MNSSPLLLGITLLPILFPLLIWLALSPVVGLYARRKGLSFALHTLLSLLLTPLFGALLVWALPANEEKLLREGRFNRCVHCAELIRPQASLCRHCGRSQSDRRETAAAMQ